MGIRRWVRRHLQSGDLTALKRLASGQAVDEPPRLDRLRRRGFIAGRPDRPWITALGRLALVTKHFSLN